MKTAKLFSALVLASIGGLAYAGEYIQDAKGCKVFNPNPQPNESIIWKGACVNGYAEGQGILEWFDNESLTEYDEGSWSRGKRAGKGSTNWANGDRYEGDYVENERTGKGLFIWADGDHYEGDFIDGKRTGQGKLLFTNGNRYQGDWVNGKAHGKGVYVWANGDRYEGDFTNGKRTGKGLFTWTNGDRYEGDFIDGQRTGKAVYVWMDGDRYEGDFVDGKTSGKGTKFYNNGDRYEGDFLDDSRHGYGVYSYYSNSAKYIGTWVNGEKYEGRSIGSDGRTRATFSAGQEVNTESLREALKKEISSFGAGHETASAEPDDGGIVALFGAVAAVAAAADPKNAAAWNALSADARGDMAAANAQAQSRGQSPAGAGARCNIPKNTIDNAIKRCNCEKGRPQKTSDKNGVLVNCDWGRGEGWGCRFFNSGGSGVR